jgi:hypothetical protein
MSQMTVPAKTWVEVDAGRFVYWHGDTAALADVDGSSVTFQTPGQWTVRWGPLPQQEHTFECPASRVRACHPPTLAVMVDGHRVEVQPPDMFGTLNRRDLVVEETRCDRPEPEVRVLMGVPTMGDPAPPSVIRNASMQQTPIATVRVLRGQVVIQDGDIAAADARGRT